MKKSIILNIFNFVVCSLMTISLFCQPLNKNYIQTVEVQTPEEDEIQVAGMPSVSQHKRVFIKYFDGLGRLIQTITVTKSPSYKDIVKHIAYDQFGRQPMEYLPFTKNNNWGNYIEGASQLQPSYYANNTDPNIPITSNPYFETHYEASPLNRPLKMASPGNSWAMDEGHTKTIQYLTNYNDNVWLWKECDGNITNNGIYYPNGKLYKEVTTDEDGNPIITFITFNGEIILIRRYTDGQYIDTYYVYNIYNQLACVIMPKAKIESGAFTDWNNAFRYFYDKRGRLIEKWLPGNEPIYYVYNKADYLVFMQDGKNRVGVVDKWKFYKYDGLGRIVMEGTYLRNITRTALQAELDNDTICHEKKEYMEGQFSQYFGYSNIAMPQLRSDSYPANVEIVYYYDNYDFNCDGNAENEYLQFWKAEPQFSDSAIKNPHGQLTGKLFVPLLYEVTFYDEYNRPVQIYNNRMYTGNQYYFNGALIKSKNSYQYSSTQEINYTFDFSYDNDWRLTGTTFTMNGTSKRLNTLEYNELSQLKAKYLNGTNTAYLQRQLYYYNARGWLTAINNPYECPNDVFAMKLYYDNVPNYASSLATGCYNGNIAIVEWFTQNQNTYVNGYGLKYDGLNRLKSGRFFSRFDASAVVEPMPTYYADGIVSGIGSEKEITYDKNGNILTLNRYGHHSGGTILFDQLSYQYNGNRLMRVVDANPNSFLSGEFCNTAAPNLQNNFDANGNLTFDVDRNMLLQYNDDNLPTNISFSNWGMTNGYRADGVKISKSIFNAEGRTVLQEEYFGNLVLNFGMPVRILHADGVIELNPNLQPTFYYHLKDHLGNIRAVVSPTATNSVHIDQTSDYYPFGMSISKNFTTTPTNKYKYNGKEEQETPGRWLDYGARFYDPQLGRWHVVDKFADVYTSLSPYCYTADNPVVLVDPNGMWIDDYYFNTETKQISVIKTNDNFDRLIINGINKGTYNKGYLDKIANISSYGGYFFNELEIKYTKNVDQSKISYYTRAIMVDAMNKSKNNSILITSGTRTPEDQARIMKNNVDIHGMEGQKSLYKASGQQVLDYYPDQKAMTDEIYRLGPSNVSKHCGDPNKINVLDIAPSSIKYQNEFKSAILNDSRVSKLLYPPKDPALHLEIPQ